MNKKKKKIITTAIIASFILFFIYILFTLPVKVSIEIINNMIIIIGVGFLVFISVFIGNAISTFIWGDD